MNAIVSAVLLVLATSAVAFAASQHDARVAPPGAHLSGSAAQVVGTAVVNFEAAARLDAERKLVQPPYIPRIMPKAHEPAEPDVIIGLAELPPARVSPAVASPSPSTSFEGLDDIPIGGTGFITIPPDVDGAVGLTRVMTGLNNNYRIFDKSTGAVFSTTSTNTFWAGSGGTINTHFDPKTIYDPINDRWIVVMMCDGGTANSSVQVGVSQTSDPAGAYYIFRVDADAGNTLWADFPSIGFNKNWVAIGMNMFTISGGAFSTGKMLVIDYPSLRAGTFVATMFSGSGFCSSPAATYSSTENTLYAPTHLSSGGGTFRIDLIMGTPAAPVYTIGATRSRGLTWTQSGGNILPQAAPLAGASACGATPCKIDCIDSQIRSTPVFRNGSIYYTQTVGAASLTRTMLQWTRIDAVTGVVQDGGRIEDPTATATNGGKWYAYGHIAVNAAGDIIVGYSQFASNQYGASAYSMHLAADAPGTMRDPFIFRAGDDYYHKTFNLTTSRNRWGDYSKAQVDPSDDQSLWVVDEWAKLRIGTDDGNTGSNSSKWGTWWANVAGPAPTVTIAPGPSNPEGNAGTTAFDFTVNLSTGYSLPVTVNYQTSDGTATTANNDYVSASGSLVIPAGFTSGTITVSGNGDGTLEGDETFDVTLTGATNATVGSPSSSTGTILNDDSQPTIDIEMVALTLEGNAGPATVNLAVTLSNASDQPVTVDWQTNDGSATLANNDYDQGSGTVTFPAKTTGPQTVTVTVNGDATLESDEALTVTLSNATGAAIGNGTSTVTVQNDDGTPTVDIEMVELTPEGNAGPTLVSLDVTLSHASDQPVTVDWQTNDGSATLANNDYDQGSGTATFPAKTTGPQTITVTVNGDVTPESDETLTVTLSSASGATIGNGTGTVTVQNDDGTTDVTAEAAVTEFAIASVVPNPTSGQASIDYTVPLAGKVRLGIVDLQGRSIAVLADGIRQPGRHRGIWNGKGPRGPVPMGVYFVRYEAGGRVMVKRLMMRR